MNLRSSSINIEFMSRVSLLVGWCSNAHTTPGHPLLHANPLGEMQSTYVLVSCTDACVHHNRAAIIAACEFSLQHVQSCIGHNKHVWTALRSQLLSGIPLQSVVTLDTDIVMYNAYPYPKVTAALALV